MKPIVVPSAARIEIKSPTQEKKDMSKEDVASVDDLSKRLTGLRNKINKAMTSKNVVDLHQPSTIDSTEIPAFVPTSKVSSYYYHSSYRKNDNSGKCAGMGLNGFVHKK